MWAGLYFDSTHSWWTLEMWPPILHHHGQNKVALITWASFGRPKSKYAGYSSSSSSSSSIIHKPHFWHICTGAKKRTTTTTEPPCWIIKKHHVHCVKAKISMQVPSLLLWLLWSVIHIFCILYQWIISSISFLMQCINFMCKIILYLCMLYMNVLSTEAMLNVLE